MTEKTQQSQEIIQWFIKYRLRNGLEGCYTIPISEKDRLWDNLPQICEEKGFGFFEFESLTHHIVMQPSQLVFFQFLFQPLYAPPDEDDEGSYAVKIYFTDNPEPVILDVNIDERDPEDEGDEGEVSNFLFNVLHTCEANEVHQLTDVDGETAFFRGSSIALVEAPLRVVEPERFPDPFEEFSDE